MPQTILDLFEKHELRPSRPVGSFEEAEGICFSTEGDMAVYLSQESLSVGITRTSRHVKGMRIPKIRLTGYYQDMLNALTNYAWWSAEHLLDYKRSGYEVIERAPEPDSFVLDFTKTLKGPKVLTLPTGFMRYPEVIEVPSGLLGILQTSGDDFRGSLGLMLLASRTKCLKVFTADEWANHLRENPYNCVDPPSDA